MPAIGRGALLRSLLLLATVPPHLGGCHTHGPVRAGLLCSAPESCARTGRLLRLGDVAPVRTEALSLGLRGGADGFRGVGGCRGPGAARLRGGAEVKEEWEDEEESGGDEDLPKPLPDPEAGGDDEAAGDPMDLSEVLGTAVPGADEGEGMEDEGAEEGDWDDSDDADVGGEEDLTSDEHQSGPDSDGWEYGQVRNLKNKTEVSVVEDKIYNNRLVAKKLTTAAGRRGTDKAAAADLVVPDDVEIMPTAMKASAWLEEGEEPVGVFVRKGTYKWDGEIFLYEKWVQDIPPMCKIGAIGINNSSEHFVMDSPLQLTEGVRKRPVLKLSGDASALLWGKWVLDTGSGTCADVQLLFDATTDMSEATFTLDSANFSFSQCGLRSVRGVCLRLTGQSNATVRDSGVGGLGSEEKSMCASGITVWDNSTLRVHRCVVTDGFPGSAGVRLCNRAEAHVQDSRFQTLFLGCALFHNASLVVSRSTFLNQTQAALFGGGKNSYNTRLVLEHSHVTGELWADKTRTAQLSERNNTHVHEESPMSKIMREELEEVQRLEQEMEALKDMKSPEELLAELVGGDKSWEEDGTGWDVLTDDHVKQLKRKMVHLRQNAMRTMNMSNQELIDEYGKEIEPFIDPEFSSDEGDGGKKKGASSARQGGSWDSSEEEGQGGLEDDDREEDRTFRMATRQLRGFVEQLKRVPEHLRSAEEQQYLREIPEVLARADTIKEKDAA